MNNLATSFDNAATSSVLWARDADGNWRNVHEENTSQQHYPASHIKLILAERAAHMAAEGELDLNKTLTVTHEITADDPHNSGYSAPVKTGQQMTVAEAIEQSLKYSSNTAYNVLLKEMYSKHFEAGKQRFPNDAVQAENHACEQITKEWQQAGYENTECQNFLNIREGHRSERYQLRLQGQGQSNITTANDIGTALQRLWTDSTQPKEQEAFNIARNALSTSPDKRDAGSIGEKISGASNVTGHAGIFEKNGTLYISVGFADVDGRGENSKQHQPLIDHAKAHIAKDQASQQQQEQTAVQPASPANKEVKAEREPISSDKPTIWSTIQSIIQQAIDSVKNFFTHDKDNTPLITAPDNISPQNNNLSHTILADEHNPTIQQVSHQLQSAGVDSSYETHAALSLPNAKAQETSLQRQ